MQQKIIILQLGGKSLANCKHNEHAVIESFSSRNQKKKKKQTSVRCISGKTALPSEENPSISKDTPARRIFLPRGESGVKRTGGRKKLSPFCVKFLCGVKCDEENEEAEAKNWLQV